MIIKKKAKEKRVSKARPKAKKKNPKKIVEAKQAKRTSKVAKKSTYVGQRKPAVLKKAPTEKKTSSVSPASMDELLKQTGYALKTFKKGDLVKAVLTDKGKRAAFFDIGAKTEGLVTSRELEWVKEYIDELNIGDTVEAKIITPENEKGQILLSLKEAANDWKWNLLEQYHKSSKPVEVRGLDVNRGGMIARIMGIRGFIPTSQFGRPWVTDLEQLYNKLFPVKIIEVDRTKNRLIFSEKEVSEEMALKKQQEALKRIKVGGDYGGEISGVMPFGLFVRIPVAEENGEIAEGESGEETTIFLDGLVHISQVSWGKIEDLQKLYRTGEKIKVKVVEIDPKTNKLNLSVKQLKPDPWENIAKKYKKDKKFKGSITRLAAFGAFVELEPGIEGLIHISKIPADQEVKVGEKVDVYIESLDKEQRRISLGLVLKEKPVGYK